MKIAFFEVAPWEEHYLQSKLTGQDLRFFPGPIDVAALTDKDFEVISIFTGSKIDSDVMDSLPNLKLIATRTTGFDHINIKAATAKNIVVCSVPAYGDNTVAEYTFALLLDISRKIGEASNRVKTESFSFEGLQGFDLLGKTIGVIGTGRIGQHSIKIANGFGMKVLAFDAMPRAELENELQFKYVPLEVLLENSDVITLHVPYLPSTHHLINEDNLNLIKKGCVLINTARGAVVQTEALIKGLQEEVFAGVGLDVLEEEGPLKNEVEFLLNDHPDKESLQTILQNHILMRMDNVVITPHNAFNTKEAVQRILDTTVENIHGFIGGNPKNIVQSS